MNPNMVVRAALANLSTTELFDLSVSMEESLDDINKCILNRNYGSFDEADWVVAQSRIKMLANDVEAILASRRRIGRSS